MPDIDTLQQDRARLLRELSEIGDLRRGSIAENYRRCGKPNCCCARSGHRGHGPQYLLMTKVEGKSHARNLKPGAELAKVKAEVGNHLRFRELVQEIVEISEQISEKRPAAEPDDMAVPQKTSRRASREQSREKETGSSHASSVGVARKMPLWIWRLPRCPSARRCTR